MSENKPTEEEEKPLQTELIEMEETGKSATDLQEEELVEKEIPSGPPGDVLFNLPGGYTLYKTHLNFWDRENVEFWNNFGKKIAQFNLWISIPNLLFAFSTWLVWSVVVVRIQEINDEDSSKFAFTKWDSNMDSAEYKSMLLILPGVAGLSGATLRLTNTFLVNVAGGPVTTTMTSSISFFAMLAMGIALCSSDVNFNTLIVIAALSGAGGGAFSSSMNNISFFFPKSEQGLALGLNAGIGNLGVSVSQLIVPLVMLGGSMGGPEYTDKNIAVQNGGFFWLPFIFVSIIFAWFGLNSLPQFDVKNKVKDTVAYWWLELIGYTGVTISAVIFVTSRSAMSDPGLKIFQAFMVVLIAVGITVGLLRYATSFQFLGNTNDKLRTDFKIFKNKHTWIMTYLYIMTFGSFIGYSSVFPKLIKDIFGYYSDGSENPDAPEATDYAWLGAFLGSVIRPVGGWLSDKYGGARVTSWAIIVTILSTVAVGIVVMEAKKADDPSKPQYFVPFLLLFLVLFLCTGIGNGSTFRMVAIIFDKKSAGPVLGWTSAIAAYGAFIFPVIFGVSVAEDFTEWAMMGFAFYYSTVWAVNYYYYYRTGCEIEC